MPRETQLRIVVIEDNPADFLMIKEALRGTGLAAELIHFEDGAQVADSLHRHDALWDAPLPDLVLLDLNMPRVSGLELLRLFREQPRLEFLPIAVLTSSQSPDDRDQAALLGASRYATKSVDLFEYFEVVNSLVRDLTQP